MQIPENINKVYKVFQDFFGEEFVDIQKNTWYYILVYYPEVYIKNECDTKHLLKDLFVKVKLQDNGKLKEQFTITRATFSKDEIRANYLHSHVNGIPERLKDFQLSCLGRGPIYNTINTLMTDSYDEEMWKLFCLELDRYIKTESLKGIPYKKISNIGNLEYNVLCSYADQNIENEAINYFIKKFIEYIINNQKINFNYTISNKYNIAFSDYKFHILLSELYIEYCKTYKYKLDYLEEYSIRDERVYTPSIYTSNLSSLLLNQPVCTFKNKEFICKIIITNHDNTSKLLNCNIVAKCKKLLTILFNYANSTERNSKENLYII